MKKLFKKIKSLIYFKKNEPWYKRWGKKIASIMDMKRRNMFIVFFGLLFLALYLSFPSLENVVKQLVHEYGSKVTGTDVSISGLDFKPTSGYAAVKDIKIENPKGYKSENLFYLKELGVKIDISTITNDIIVVDSIKITEPKITYEMLSLTQNNISDLLNNIQTNTASPKDNTSKKETKKTKAQQTSSKKVIIKTLSVDDGIISVMAGIGSLKEELSLPLPKIEMHNIGQEKQGSSIKDTVNLVIKKILNSATDTVVSQNLENFKNTANNELKNLTSDLKDGADTAKDKIKDELKNLITF